MAHKILAFAFVMSLPMLTFAQDQWTLRRDEGGIQVYSRAMPGSRFDQVRAVMNTRASLQAGLAMLQDVARRPHWDAACKQARVDETLADGSRLIYYVIAMPWPFEDRDALVQTFAQRQDNQAIVRSHAVNNRMPEQHKRVRVTVSNVQWTITDLGANEREIELISHSEPGAALPAKIVNMLMDKLPWRSLHGLRTLLETP